MKTKGAFLVVSIIALILIVALVSMKEYYIAIAFAAGALVIGHREVWYLMKRRKLPPVDERVRENMSKSTRNGFFFFTAASAFLMLAFSIKMAYIVGLNPVHVMSGLFLAGGLVYLISYIFYDRIEPRLNEKGRGRLGVFLRVAGIGVGVFIISVFLHNAISAVLGIEEPVFFVIAVILAPVAVAVGLIGSLITVIRALVSQPS